MLLLDTEGTTTTEPPSIEDLRERIDIQIAHEEIWEKFDNVEMEMIVSRTGRKLFPRLEFFLTGLEPNNRYLCSLVFDHALNASIKYKYFNGKWYPYGGNIEEVEISEFPHFNNELFPTGEQWMFTTVSFDYLKIVNTTAEVLEEKKYTHPRLASMRKYRPAFLLYRLDPVERKFDLLLRKEFPRMEFIATTCYHNKALTSLKIRHNRFCKGYNKAKDVNASE